MTRNEVLRMACEEAGLDFSPDGARVVWAEPDGVLLEDFLVWENPALPAYVAELLVAKIVEHDPGNKRLHAFEAYLHRHARLSISTASAVIRIPAALVALRKLTLEQAQEVK